MEFLGSFTKGLRHLPHLLAAAEMKELGPEMKSKAYRIEGRCSADAGIYGAPYL